MSIKFWLMHNRSRIITALVFCLVFSLLAFAPPFSTSAHAIALADDAIFLILAALLASSGILLVSDSSADVTDFLQDAVNDFCSDVGESWDTIKSGFKFGVDKLGNILTDNSVLSFFGRFSDWMTRYYSLSDNTSSVIAGSTMSYIPLAGGGAIYINDAFSDANGATVLRLGQSYTFANGVTFRVTKGSDNVLRAYVNDSQIASEGNNRYVTMYWLAYYIVNGSYVWACTTTTDSVGTVSPSRGGRLYLGADPFGFTPTAPSGAIVNADTSVIDIPVAGTDYTDDDGAVIGGIGSWGDSWNELLEKLREWLDAQSSATVADPTLTVEAESEIAADIETDLLSTDNWPGMIPPSAFPEFSFSSIWHYVTDWLAAFSGTLATVLGISFALPAVSIVYAVIVLSLTLWLLRKVSS